MKIGFLLQPWDNGSPPDPGGSIGLWTWEAARRLAHSCEVLVCGPRHQGQQPFERWEGVEFARIPLKQDRLMLAAAAMLMRLRGKRHVTANSRIYYRLYAIHAARILRDRRCDVIHVHNFSQFVPLVRRLNPQARIVLHMHCDWLAQLEFRSIEARLDCADLVVGNSDYVTSRIRQRFPAYANRCVTVFNGVDEKVFHPAESGIQDSSGACIVYVGRISPEKGVHVLLDAFEHVLALRPDARLHIVGGAQTAPKEFIVDVAKDSVVRNLGRFYGGENYIDFLRRRVRGAMTGRVSFEGEFRHEALAKFLRKADVLVLPSLVETFGLPAAEAMATGLPVVASRVGGLPEVVAEGETGILAEPDSPPALAQALLSLLDNPMLAKSMGSAGRRRAERLFSWDGAVERLRSHYAMLCGDMPEESRSSRISAGSPIMRMDAPANPLSKPEPAGDTKSAAAS